MAPKTLSIINARENNLKDLSLEIEHDTFTVVTGLSGSGKSSLAFDTVYAEGQRRYIETFSPYTRQFFDKVKRPDVDLIENVRPAVAIEQRTRIHNSRSTVGSMTSINDYLKLVWGNLAEPICPRCNVPVSRADTNSVTEFVLGLLSKDAELIVGLCAPIKLSLPKAKKLRATTLHIELERLKILGYSRLFNPETAALEEFDQSSTPLLESGDILNLVIDRVRGDVEAVRIRDSAEQAFNLARGHCTIVAFKGAKLVERVSFSNSYVCGGCGLEILRSRPAMFSYNSPIGACDECKGFGKILSINQEQIVPNPSLTLTQGAIGCWTGKKATWERRQLAKFCAARKIPMDRPWLELDSNQRDLLLNTDTREYCGVLPWFKWLEGKVYKMHVRVFLARYRSQAECPSCKGARLKADALAYRINSKTLPDAWSMPIEQLLPFLTQVREQRQSNKTLPRQLKDVFDSTISRLQYLSDLGLPYLNLERQSRTLSGGETQRVNLATALGSEIVSTQFVLDEPTVGLHSRDTLRLVEAIKRLTERGNSVLIVEHDLDCIAAAERIIELGPEAGERGGEVVFHGPTAAWRGIKLDPEGSFTNRPSNSALKLSVKKATARNLKNISCEIPLNSFVVLSGVSGSGKSTLIHEVIKRAFDLHSTGQLNETGRNLVSGFESIDQLLLIDQSPLARTPRANIATYSGIWERVRELLAGTEAAQLRALTRSSFSFNVEGGRCPACSGAGFIREDMQFLSDVFIPCEVCLGRRFQEAVLEVSYKGRNVHELLSMSIDGCLALFSDEKNILALVQTLQTLGLGHLRLGHPLSELSGGEAQRLKLVPFIAESTKGRSLLVFDEPTTGLHPHDVERLCLLLRKLCDKGHSILCVEHNLPLISKADWVIDLGPEGGEGGGAIIRSGSPEDFLGKGPFSHTAIALKRFAKQLKEPLSGPKAVVERKHEAPTALQIRGARVHNLKNIDLDVPLNKIVTITGVSGSGKSSIAKDIIYAEGQRRYLDCLSPYARQFIHELARPEIDKIVNIMPTVCVYQHTFQPSHNSTVGTMSEVYNFLRLLFSKVGVQYCPDHTDQRISPLNAEAIAQQIKANPVKSVRILAPIIKLKKGTHQAVLQRAIDSEITEVRVDGRFGSPASFFDSMPKAKAHSVDYTVAKFNPHSVSADLIRDTVAQALALGGGQILLHDGATEQIFSTERACPVCHKGFFKPDPEDLSFHSKRGACLECSGTGLTSRGATCSECGGARINSLGRNLRIEGLNIAELTKLKSAEVSKFVNDLSFDNAATRIAAPVLQELRAKLDTLIAVGLDYLALGRDCTTLSGGELQRLRLATAMGSPLSGVMYIFDEPSAGLHPLDNEMVLARLSGLRERGNSIIMIEHDARSILASDHVIDVGPGGGRDGGEILFSGTTANFIESDSVTAKEIRAKSEYLPEQRVNKEQGSLKLSKVSCHNISNLSLEIPLHRLVTVAGVSGAGKSSLVHGILCHAITDGAESKKRWKIGAGTVVSDTEIERVVFVDQKPIGKNSRSTPASYLGIWDEVRKLYAGALESKARGWSSSFFSYNSGKGRCQTCQGLGFIRLEMNFLPDAETICESCLGKRFSDQAQSILYRGLSVSQILGLTFAEAKVHFAQHKKIHQMLHLACELGLGYLSLGQSSTTLSGGESQRIKLVSELSASRRGHTLYVLDEPTTGLHRSDVTKLLRGLVNLVSKGNSVIVIEHDDQVLAASDQIIELGPGPGEQGGKVIFQGTIQQLEKEHTPWGRLLRQGAVVSQDQGKIKNPNKSGRSPLQRYSTTV